MSASRQFGMDGIRESETGRFDFEAPSRACKLGRAAPIRRSAAKGKAPESPLDTRTEDMRDDIYRKLAKVLDTLPNGFPATESGLEIKLLEKIFTPEEADLFCDLRLKFETPIQVAERTGRPLEWLDEMLTRMWREKGQIQGVELGPTRVFKMLPWVIGIFEMQVDRMDEELAQLCNEYYEHFGKQFFARGPRLMRTIPIEQDVTPSQQTLSYDRVSGDRKSVV